MDTKTIYDTIVTAAADLLKAYNEADAAYHDTETRRQGLEDKLNKIAEILNS